MTEITTEGVAPATETVKSQADCPFSIVEDYLGRINKIEVEHCDRVNSIELEMFREVAAITMDTTEAYAAMKVYFRRHRQVVLQNLDPDPDDPSFGLAPD